MADPGPLIDVHQLGGGHTGNETWARNVARTLESDGGPPAHYAVTDRGVLELAVPLERRHLVSGSSGRRLAWELPRLVRRLRPSALLVQYTLPPVLRVPGVAVVHDVSFVQPEARAWIPAHSLLRYRLTIGASVRRAKVLVVPSEYSRRELIAHYGRHPDDVVVAPLALDPVLAQLLVTAPPLARTRTVTVLCVGTVLPRKNLPVVARAVARLRASGDDVRLRLVGPVRQAGRLDLSQMRELLGDGLEVVGSVTPEQLAREYRAASVLAFPSRYEGFGLPLLEAMAAGTPVVSSDATCLPEIAGDAALLVPPDDVAGWVLALASVLRDDGTADRLRGAGHRRVTAFTWEATGSAVRRALEQAAG